MNSELFSQSWAEGLGAELLSSAAYRQAAAGWEGSLALVSLQDGGERAVFLDLWHGDCRSARLAVSDDLDVADYVLAADLPVWQKVLRGELEPIFALMAGKLKLRRGSLARLTPHVLAARELVRAAARVSAST